MAQLLVSAAVNIGIGIALNLLFRPPGQDTEGPRLKELGFTSSVYGKMVNIPFGTDRQDGNIVYGQDIEEVEVSQEIDTKGGSSNTDTQYVYFLTFTVSFCVSGAEDILRVWADGKLIFDKTGNGVNAKNGVDFTFYPGGPSQGKDSIEVADLGEANTPAYRHLTRIRFNRLPLANFANRPPNITAEVTYNATRTNPFVGTQEFTGLDVPGSASGADTSYMAVDPNLNSYFSLKSGILTNAGTWRADSSTGAIQAGPTFKSANWTGGDGYGHEKILTAADGTGVNVVPRRLNAVTFETEAIANFTVVEPGEFRIMRVGGVSAGFKLIGIRGGASIANDQVDVFDLDEMLFLKAFTVAGSILTSDENVVIPDDSRGFDSGNAYVVATDGSQQHVFALTFMVNLGSPSAVEIEDRGTFSFPTGSNLTEGWAVNATNGYLILSNVDSTIIYDPEAQSVVTSSSAVGFAGRNNYIRSSLFGYAKGGQLDGVIEVIDPNSLELIDSIATDFFADSWRGVHDPSSVWDDDGQAVIFSRVSQGVPGGVVSPERVVRVFVNKAEGGGVGLDFVVQKLSTNYQGLVMGGLEDSDTDVSALVGQNVEGFTINNPGTLRDAFNVLRIPYFFDYIQSDWLMKATTRGGSPVLTIAAQDVGEVNFSDTDPRVVQETRELETQLPMKLNLRYSNREIDYGADVEHAKRLQAPVRAMYSDKEDEVNVPVVFPNGTQPKQAVEQLLFTIWNERKRVGTIVPWKYLRLDPADVFNMEVFDELLRLRMGEQDVGLGFAMDITGIVEQAFTFDSSVQGSNAAGFITQAIPSPLQTKLILLDAPLLNAVDLSQGQISAAYLAMGAYEENWPGASAMLSSDDVNYETRATSTSEMAWGFVSTVPGAVASNDCGDFPNTFQETTAGGTMQIIVQRRLSSFASVSELDVYNGNNAIAVVTSSGVEVIQFQDVTTPDVNRPNEIQFERLLRGRLGTEDIANAASIAVGDLVVLLQGQPGTNEFAAIAKARIPFSLVGQSRFWKGVSTGTLIEQATNQVFTYTGRDLKPYSPVLLSVAAGSPNGVQVSWTRRTRINGEWLDGTGTVPLNESLEQYKVGINAVTMDPEQLLIVPFDGADGAKSATDFSSFNRPLTFGNDAALSTDQKQFGSASVEIALVGADNGQTDAFVSVPDADDLSFGASEQFTIQCWVRFKDLTQTNQIIISKGENTNVTPNEREWWLERNGNNFNFVYSTTGSAIITVGGVFPEGGPATDRWYHVAADRDSSDVIRAYVDGEVVGSATVASAFFSGTGALYIGKRQDQFSDRPTNGWIDDVNIVEGRAVYGGAFTPPTERNTIPGDSVFTKTVDDVTVTNIGTADFSAPEVATFQAQVQQVSGTGLLSPRATCPVPDGLI